MPLIKIVVVNPLDPDAGLAPSTVIGSPSQSGYIPGIHTDDNQSLAKRQILIVEDEAMIGIALEMGLEDIGVTPVGPAKTLSEALDIVDATQVDGAILDVDLNGVDVYPLADHLIERGVAIVFYTGHGARQKFNDVYPDVPVCYKPATTQEVLAKLNKVFWDRGRN